MNGTVALLGPVIGVAMMFITPASLEPDQSRLLARLRVRAPAAGIAMALLFFDLRIRTEGVRTSPETARLEREERPESPGVGPAPEGA